MPTYRNSWFGFDRFLYPHTWPGKPTGKVPNSKQQNKDSRSAARKQR
jgi:hypothetical protein